MALSIELGSFRQARAKARRLLAGMPTGAAPAAVGSWRQVHRQAVHFGATVCKAVSSLARLPMGVSGQERPSAGRSGRGGPPVAAQVPGMIDGPFPKPQPETPAVHLQRLTVELRYLIDHVGRLKGVSVATAMDVRAAAEDLATWVQGVVDKGTDLR